MIETSLAQSADYSQHQFDLLNPKNYQSLLELFNESCHLYRDKPAFSCLGHTLTFNDVDVMSRNFAAYLLHETNLKQGDRIAIQLPNLSQYPIAAWGALRAGLILVNTNPLYTQRELIHQFNDAKVKALVVLESILPNIEAIVEQTSIEKVIVSNPIDFLQAQPLPQTSLPEVITLPDALARGEELLLPLLKQSMDDIAVLQYTGGTTGLSKGVILTQGNLFASNRMASMMLDEETAEEDDIIISPMPLYHVYGFTFNVIRGFVNGGLSVLIPDPRDLTSMINTMKSYPFNGFAGVNTLFVGLLNHPDFDSIDFSHLKGVISGGAALVEEISNEWFKRTNSTIYEAYGLSETSAIVTCNNPEFNQLGTVGRPMPHLEVKTVDALGNELACGEAGELVVRGPHVMKGYWQAPEASAEVLDNDGWFRTGDIAIIQTDGFIKIVDRLKDMVLVSGFNVYPNEVEAVIYGHPDVVECAVVGVADQKTGEAVKLFVVSRNPELDGDSLKTFCRERLAAYKVPKYYEFKESLPKSNVGKILRKELR
jgi:long-chain acyl-CoA synthetase